MVGLDSSGPSSTVRPLESWYWVTPLMGWPTCTTPGMFVGLVASTVATAAEGMGASLAWTWGATKAVATPRPSISSASRTSRSRWRCRRQAGPPCGLRRPAWVGAAAWMAVARGAAGACGWGACSGETGRRCIRKAPWKTGIRILTGSVVVCVVRARDVAGRHATPSRGNAWPDERWTGGGSATVQRRSSAAGDTNRHAPGARPSSHRFRAPTAMRTSRRQG